MPLVVCLECPELCPLEVTEVLALLATRLGGKTETKEGFNPSQVWSELLQTSARVYE